MTLEFDLSKIEGFDWDKGNLEHTKKHKVTYIECEEVFSNIPFLVNEDKLHSRREERFQALGQTNYGKSLFIAFTIRKNKIRVISARDQNRNERIKYMGQEVKINK